MRVNRIQIEFPFATQSILEIGVTAEFLTVNMEKVANEPVIALYYKEDPAFKTTRLRTILILPESYNSDLAAKYIGTAFSNVINPMTGNICCYHIFEVL